MIWRVSMILQGGVVDDLSEKKKKVVNDMEGEW